MPTYVYKCDSCGSQFEQFQSFKDEPLRVCPCGKEGAVRRVFQPVGIVFKGSGWYITDSRKSDSATVGTETSASEKPSTDAAPAAPAATETAPATEKSTSETKSAPAQS
ncbi:MAG TPA: zinc ribbon domain-containing protein [Roseiflexaceae bacterium]|nr:zinc ribbon domain-containing protein [Roseiflexaceae bacterium]HMP39622.1 zinc ribbon domain-containing protein [Roseiflexaceae bacterium]